MFLHCDSLSHCGLYHLACLHAIHVSLYDWHFMVLKKIPITQQLHAVCATIALDCRLAVAIMLTVQTIQLMATH